MDVDRNALGTGGPFRSGMTSSGERAAPAQDAQAAKALRVGQAKALGDLAAEFGFFTPALLYLWVPRANMDPLQSFIREYGKSVSPFTIAFDRPLFQGLSFLGNRFWDCHLMALEREHWLPFMSWTRSLFFVDTPRQLLTRVRPMTIQIADPLVIANAAVLPPQVPSVEVGVLALDTNRGSVWLDDSGNKLQTLPSVRADKQVYRDTQVFADALFAENADPWRKVEEAELDPTLGLTPAQAWLLEQYGDREPLRVPGKIDISELPQDEQREIHRLMAEYAKRML